MKALILIAALALAACRNDPVYHDDEPYGDGNEVTANEVTTTAVVNCIDPQYADNDACE